jgi:hypothetical protein
MKNNKNEMNEKLSLVVDDVFKKYDVNRNGLLEAK